jgi:microsomal dipeptidase-like Zn-dependent dipeptidase
MMSGQARAGGARFQAGMVVDAHVHTTDYLPAFATTVYRWATRRTVPPLFFLDQLASAGVDAVVANAVGDRAATAWWGRPPWRAVEEQLRRIRVQAERAHVALATSAAQVRQACDAGRTAVVLGLEGGDGIGMHLSRVDELSRWGVRLLVPVHLRDNRIGTTCLPWNRYLGIPSLSRGRRRGLTEFGGAVIERMNHLGMIIDVSHSDAATLHDIADRSGSPIVASHSGARRVEDFARFLDDDEIRAVARTGGVVGLWPYHYKGHGAADLDALMRHARYIADLVGPSHLCLGTDINGVPGTLAGYRGEKDVRVIAARLRSAGFNQDDIAKIMGDNFMRVFAEVAARSGRGGTARSG